MDYTIVIGLEVHVQLLTESKMFSACGTEFGLPPNTQTDPVSLGLPGTLPVMNRKAFELALKTAVALNAEIAPFTKWDRKNYYYPDLPKNYQISQYDLPFSTAGWLEIPARKDGGGRRPVPADPRPPRRRRRQADARRRGLLGGRPEPRGHPAAGDRHRARHPQPGRTPRRAWKSCGSRSATWASPTARCRRAASAATPTSTSTSHEDGKTIATPIVEIKNLNSFRAVEQAPRLRGRAAVREVAGRRPDDQGRPQGRPAAGTTPRGSPSPSAEGDGGRLPLLPRARPRARRRRRRLDRPDPRVDRRAARRRVGERFEAEYGLSPYDANVLVEQGQDVADYYDAVARATGEYKLASNWVQQDVLRTIKDKKLDGRRVPRRAPRPWPT